MRPNPCGNPFSTDETTDVDAAQQTDCVRLYVRLSVCLTVRLRISKTAHPNFTKLQPGYSDERLKFSSVMVMCNVYNTIVMDPNMSRLEIISYQVALLGFMVMVAV